MSKSAQGSTSRSNPKLRRGHPLRSKPDIEWGTTQSDGEVRTMHSDAGMVTLFGDGGFLINRMDRLEHVSSGSLYSGEILSVYAPKRVNGQATCTGMASNARPRFVKRCPDEEIDAARQDLLPYAVPQSCRIEVLANIKRTATDCRRDFELAADPVGKILQALREICPDATAEELRAVLISAEAELHAKIVRLGGWHTDVVGATAEIETWLELAKKRLYNLHEALLMCMMLLPCP
jgi:hypothetical protein